MSWDLNCDLGEGESSTRTQVLMKWITSANVACGGHAGDVASMLRCVDLAIKHGVRLGAHPGSWDRPSFGRAPVRISPDELRLLLLHQVGALERLARTRGVRLHHIKLHGALYHAVEKSAVLARSYLSIVQAFWPRAKVYGLATGAVMQESKRAGVVVWGEAFADRGYLSPAHLVPRNQPGALVQGRSELTQRLDDLRHHSRVTSIRGDRFPVLAKTLCLHSDTPSALRIAKWIRQELDTTES